MKKSIVLVLALLLPVLVFLFLHFFGKNEFEIPIFHQTSSVEILTDCDIEYTFPYHVTDSKISINGTSVIFFSGEMDADGLANSLFQLSRLKSELKHPLPIFTVDYLTRVSEGVVALDSMDYVHEKNCVFITGENRIVLIDNASQIRGYYKDASLKEIDRLILESKILFNEY